MVCGYALGHYLEHQILMDLHTLNKSLAITDKEICLYEPNAFASHLMLDSEEVYQMTKRNQKPLTPENTQALTHHDKQKQVEVKRSSRANPHEIRLFSGCPYAVVK